MKWVFVTMLLSVSLFGAIWSQLSDSVPNPLEQLKQYITQRTATIESKLIGIQNGVMVEIENQLELKQKNNNKLRELSKVDYIFNKRMEFLLHKENMLSDINIDTASTGNVPNYLHINKIESKNQK